MSTEITRMYATAEAAHAAAAELREEGFEEIFVVSPPAGDVPASAIAAQIALGRVLLADARIYAEGVKAGSTLLTIHVPFGSGRLASVILDGHGPIPSGMPEPEPERVWNESTPFSSAMMMPLLLDDATPASKVIGIPALMSGKFSLSEAIGLPLATGTGNAPESRWGLPFLCSDPAPLSSRLGLPLLWR